MRTRWLFAVTATASLLVWPLLAASSGKATGTFVVSRKSVPLRHAYVTEKNGLIKIILSDQSLDEKTLQAARGLENFAAEKSLYAVVVQLNEESKAEEVFFFHPKLPAGLSVRELSTFEPTISNKLTLGGRVKFQDPGFSFSYDATFLAPISKIIQQVEPLATDASPRDHALWRLKLLEIEFDEANFRDRVVNGDAESVKLFLTAGMPVSTGGALPEAVERGHAEVARILIAAGADVSAVDGYGQSLVMRSSSANKPEVLKALIDSGANVNLENEYKIAPLAAAAEQGQLEIVRLLLAGGANVNARNTYGGTALSVAILRGYEEVVIMLLNAGADVERDKVELLELAKDHPKIRQLIEEASKGKKR